MIPLSVALVTFVAGHWLLPWPAHNPYLVVLRSDVTWLYWTLTTGYYGMWFSSPWLCCVACIRLAGRLHTRSLRRDAEQPGAWPVPVPSHKREHLSVTLGAVYHPKRLGVAVPRPKLAVIPEYGLYTGVMALASTGWGKTRWILKPMIDQLLGWQRHDEQRKIGGLCLEVKGTFCDSVRDILRSHGREQDYIELSPGGPWKYNPVDPGMSPSAVASTINNLLINLHGEDRDKYWSQAVGEAIKNIVQLFRRIQNGHCTLHDILLALTDEEFLMEHIKAETEKSKDGVESIIVPLKEYSNRKVDLERQGFKLTPEAIAADELRAPFTKELQEWLKAKKIPYQVEFPVARKKDRQLASITRWFWHTWKKVRPDIRTSITSGMTPFLSLFDDDPQVFETFCPAADDPALFCGWQEAIESGKMVCVRFDTITDLDMCKMLGVLIKQAYMRTTLRRIPRMRREPGYYRQTVLIVDECHELMTGGLKGFGDDKFLAQSREAKCIALFATQSISSLRAVLHGKGAEVVLGNLKNKIFGHTDDVETAKYASEMCGQEDRWIPHVSMGESGQKSKAGVLGAGTVADSASVSANKGYNQRVDPIFRPHVFLNDLANGQAIARIYDGTQTETTVVYLTPAAAKFGVN